MEKKSKFTIRAAPEMCTGCLRCRLACSERHTGAFNPLNSMILVDGTGVYSRTEFSSSCDQCGICVTQCLYGALERVEKEAER
jgi:NAD-dependent dihydropyrimidine dehydrogenase PreA subunit